MDLRTGEEQSYSPASRSEWSGSGRPGELVARRFGADECLLSWVDAGTGTSEGLVAWKALWPASRWAASDDHRYVAWAARDTVTILDLATRQSESFETRYFHRFFDGLTWAPGRNRLALVAPAGVFVLDYDARAGD